MDVNTRKLKSLVRFMRTSGLIHLKMDGFELSLDPKAVNLPETKSNEQMGSSDPIVPQTTYTEEDALFWSAPGINPQ